MVTTDLPLFSTSFYNFTWSNSPLFSLSFLHYLATPLYYWDLIFVFVYSLTSDFNSQGYPLSNNSSPFCSMRCFHSIVFSAPLSRIPTFVVIRYFRDGFTACLFTSKLAIHLFSGWHCHFISSV